MNTSRWRYVAVATASFLLGMFMAGPAAVAAAWQPIARLIGLESPPEPSSANVLSEHEIAALDGMPPQAQAVLLLERSINHYQGANQQIAARVDGWRGHLTIDNGRLSELFTTAINSGDLTVRVAGVEIDIAARNIVKDPSTVDRLEPIARTGEQGPRVNAMWDLALIGNRGIAPERIQSILLDSVRDPNMNVRWWAVEALAHLATDGAIAPLLEVFHDDPLPTIRERAACGLAQSGMFTAAQRRSAVPKLLDFATDGALDEQTRTWVFQALRDITGEGLPPDGLRWRTWYEKTRR